MFSGFENMPGIHFVKGKGFPCSDVWIATYTKPGQNITSHNGKVEKIPSFDFPQSFIV